MGTVPFLRRGFTLVELLVTITIIGMLAGMMLGALQLARNAARDAATKSTIAKLNSIIMQRYESYMTRRAPITIPAGTTPADAAAMRLNAIRDLMRMEMPDHYNDITTGPLSFRGMVNGQLMHYSVPEPALHRLYNQKYNAAKNAGKAPDPLNNQLAKCLYLVVSMGSPEVMEQFSQSEIGVDPDGWQYFVDGHGASISFLRWAPGFSNRLDLLRNAGFQDLTYAGSSDIQSGDPINDHDPFDTRHVDAPAFRLAPLIYSSYGLNDSSCIFSGDGNPQQPYQCPGNPYQTFFDSTSSKNLLVGTPTSGAIAGIITNHHIEQR